MGCDMKMREVVGAGGELYWFFSAGYRQAMLVLDDGQVVLGLVDRGDRDHESQFSEVTDPAVALAAIREWLGTDAKGDQGKEGGR